MTDRPDDGSRDGPGSRKRKKRPSIRVVVEEELPARSIVTETLAAEGASETVAAASPAEFDPGDDAEEEMTAVDVKLPEAMVGSDGPDTLDEDSDDQVAPVHETVHVSDIPPALLAGDIPPSRSPSKAGFDEVTQELSIADVDEHTVPPPDDLEDGDVSELAQGTPTGKTAAVPPPPPEGRSTGPMGKPALAKGPLPFPALGERERPWFETFFSDDYLRTVPPPPERYVARQCDFIEKTLNLSKGATVLDVGCGLGLHAVELASRGYLVVGLDLSLPMLSRAGDEAQDRGVKLNFLHGDMREMTFDGAFDAVICWGTTFGYFEDDANRRVIERLFQALRPRGRALIDVVNRDYVVRNQPNLVWFEGDGCICMEETQFNYISARLEVKRTVILDDNQQRENLYSIRLYTLHELGQLLHSQGFRVASVSGHEALPGVFFGADSSRMIVLAERRGPDNGDRPSTVHEVPPPPPSETDGNGKKTGEQPPPVPGGDANNGG